MRAVNLANILANRGHQVVIWSALFFHQEKRKRDHLNFQFKYSQNIEYRLIDSPGYIKHIGFSRLFDHACLAWNLRKSLNREIEFPDAAFIGYPPIEAAFIMSGWLKKRNIPFLLDVKDMWPDIFLEIFPRVCQWVGKIALYPYFYMAKKIINRAAGVTTISNDFFIWIEKTKKISTSIFSRVLPLVAPKYHLSDSDSQAAKAWWENQGLKGVEAYKFGFVGSLSRAFNFEPIFEAAAKCMEEGISCQFIICGDGPKKIELMKRASKFKNVIFPGWIDRPQAEFLKKDCLAILAPYEDTKDFSASIPNKVIDAWQSGKLILCSLGDPFQRYLNDNLAGLSYCNDRPNSFYNAMNELIKDSGLVKRLESGASELYLNEFDFERNFINVAKDLETLAHGVKY
jgi:glycosyltransferase involved in cell wall biosynthesis